MIKRRILTTLTASLFLASPCLIQAQDAKKETESKTKKLPSAADQIKDLSSLPDFTKQLQQTIDQSGGNLAFVKTGIYRITQPLIFDLTKHGAAKVTGSAGVTLIMDGPGPALKFVGSHQGTASPKSFQTKTWDERMPIVSGIEIIGNHPEAVGIELFQTMEPIISRVSVRWCLHGIRLATRNRNVTISDCHLYENSGVGIYLDDVNLHQINVSNCHISYNRQGGIVVRDGNVRNLQITGCDIEGNMPGEHVPTKAANILLDVSATAGDKKHSIAEVTITSCTIQHSANYSDIKGKYSAVGGANIRILGKESWPINSVTITGNVISDTENNIDITHAYDVTINSNALFAPSSNHLLVKNSERIVVSGNSFNPRQFERPAALIFTDSKDCVLSSSTIHAAKNPAGAVQLNNCSNMLLSALNLTENAVGISLNKTDGATISNCRISRTLEGGADIIIGADNKNIQLSGNAFSGKSDIDTAAKLKK
ncbi:MAG: right-handed parallel beta-helix repeat-containing protein [Verrucomicrobiales bacterium]|nr:right-handed parallel beta-helix repeat-containing protein [Verrucomicrobiales bacterium]